MPKAFLSHSSDDKQIVRKIKENIGRIWTYFDEEARHIFLEGLSRDMINRARGWALWKALITYDDVNDDFGENARYTIDCILKEAHID